MTIMEIFCKRKPISNGKKMIIYPNILNFTIMLMTLNRNQVISLFKSTKNFFLFKKKEIRNKK